MMHLKKGRELRQFDQQSIKRCAEMADEGLQLKP